MSWRVGNRSLTFTGEPFTPRSCIEHKRAEGKAIDQIFSQDPHCRNSQISTFAYIIIGKHWAFVSDRLQLANTATHLSYLSRPRKWVVHHSFSILLPFIPFLARDEITKKTRCTKGSRGDKDKSAISCISRVEKRSIFVSGVKTKKGKRSLPWNEKVLVLLKQRIYIPHSRKFFRGCCSARSRKERVVIIWATRYAFPPDDCSQYLHTVAL